MPFYSKFGVPIDTQIGRNVTIQPKLKFKFRVRFIKFGGLESASYSFDSTQQVISVQRPSINFAPKEINSYAGTIKLFNKPKFNPVTIRFRDDMANALSGAVSSQLQKQYDFVNGRYAVSAGSAKFSMIIETLNGVDEVRAVDAFRLEGCFISNIEFGEMAYNEGTFNEINLTIDYDYLGGYYTEQYGIDDAKQLMWYVTSSATSYATNPPLAFNNNEEDVADRILNNAGDTIKSTVKDYTTWLNGGENNE